MNPIRLSRRTLLRGAGIAVALPTLDAMLDGKGLLHGTASAQARKPPTRLVIFFIPNGVSMGDWVPTTTGTGFRTTKVHGAARALPWRHQRAVRHRPRHPWGRRRARMGHLGLCHVCEQLPKRRRRAFHGSGCGAAPRRCHQVPIAGGLRQHRSSALRYQPLVHLLQRREQPGAADPRSESAVRYGFQRHDPSASDQSVGHRLASPQRSRFREGRSGSPRSRAGVERSTKARCTSLGRARARATARLGIVGRRPRLCGSGRADGQWREVQRRGRALVARHDRARAQMAISPVTRASWSPMGARPWAQHRSSTR